MLLDNCLIILYNLFNNLIFAERKQNAEVADSDRFFVERRAVGDSEDGP